jgi:uncharacterized protein YegJ (DUF2314 family)
MKYELKDFKKASEENPCTYNIPSEDEICEIKRGHFAKLHFTENGSNERLWVVINEITPTGFIGALDNDPEILRSIKRGNTVEFEVRHIASTWG